MKIKPLSFLSLYCLCSSFYFCFKLIEILCNCYYLHAIWFYYLKFYWEFHTLVCVLIKATFLPFQLYFYTLPISFSSQHQPLFLNSLSLLFTDIMCLGVGPYSATWGAYWNHIFGKLSLSPQNHQCPSAPQLGTLWSLPHTCLSSSCRGLQCALSVSMNACVHQHCHVWKTLVYTSPLHLWLLHSFWLLLCDDFWVLQVRSVMYLSHFRAENLLVLYSLHLFSYESLC